VTTRVERVYTAMCLLLLCVAARAQLFAQTSNCNIAGATPEGIAEAQRSWDMGGSPVYADATNLARELTRRGIMVECLLDSKESRRVTNQKGAAWFKTDKGIFDAWFMIDTESAAAVEAMKRQNASTNEFFVQYKNIVFHITKGQSTLAAELKNAFPASLRTN
jgi:hypothetical protein